MLKVKPTQRMTSKRDISELGSCSGRILALVSILAADGNLRGWTLYRPAVRAVRDSARSARGRRNAPPATKSSARQRETGG